VAAIEIIDFRFRAQLRSHTASPLPISCPLEETSPTSAGTNSTVHYCHNRGGVQGVAGLKPCVHRAHWQQQWHRPQEKKDGQT